MGQSIQLPPKTDNKTNFIIRKKLLCHHTLHPPHKLHVTNKLYFSPKSAVRPGVSMVTQQIFVENEICPVICFRRQLYGMTHISL